MKRRSWLLRLFPSAWRARYGDEFEALLEDLGPRRAVSADVLLAALRAWSAHRPSLGRGSHTGVRIARVILALVLVAAPVASGAVGYYLGIRDREADAPRPYPASESAFLTCREGTYPTGSFTVFFLDTGSGTWVPRPMTPRTWCPAAP